MKLIPRYQNPSGPLTEDDFSLRVEDIKHPSGHYLNETVVTPNRTYTGTLPREAMWELFQESLRNARRKNTQDNYTIQHNMSQTGADIAKGIFEAASFPAAFNPVIGSALGTVYGATAAKDIKDNGLNWSNGIQLGLSALPLGIAGYKGFRYASKAIPKFMYRGKPSLKTNKVFGREAITQEDLMNRKFFSVDEYGSEPIYTRETAPSKIKLQKGDITESHMNDGTPGSETIDANKVANDWFNKADHGQSVSYESDYSLSSDSYPLALLKMHRWLLQGLGQFVQSETSPLWMRLNRLGNKSFEELQKSIEKVNKLTGQNYRIEKRLEPMIGASGKPMLHPITKLPLMAEGIYVQPLSFFKYRNGNKIFYKR